MSDTPIQRYEVEEVCRGMDCYSVMRKNPDGDYVMHDDHVAQLTAANAHIVELEKERDEIETQLSDARSGWESALTKADDANRQLSESQAQLAASSERMNQFCALLDIECAEATPEDRIRELQAQLASAREDGERLIDAITSVTDWKGTHVGDVISAINADRGVLKS